MTAISQMHLNARSKIVRQKNVYMDTFVELVKKGQLAIERSKVREAEHHFRSALASWAKGDGNESLLLAQCFMHLSDTLRLSGNQMREKEQLYLRSLDVSRKVLAARAGRDLDPLNGTKEEIVSQIVLVLARLCKLAFRTDRANTAEAWRLEMLQLLNAHDGGSRDVSFGLNRLTPAGLNAVAELAAALSSAQTPSGLAQAAPLFERFLLSANRAPEKPRTVLQSLYVTQCRIRLAEIYFKLNTNITAAATLSTQAISTMEQILIANCGDRKGMASTHAIPEIFLSALEVAAAVLPLSQDPVVQRQGRLFQERFRGLRQLFHHQEQQLRELQLRGSLPRQQQQTILLQHQAQQQNLLLGQIAQHQPRAMLGHLRHNAMRFHPLQSKNDVRIVDKGKAPVPDAKDGNFIAERPGKATLANTVTKVASSEATKATSATNNDEEKVTTKTSTNPVQENVATKDEVVIIAGPEVKQETKKDASASVVLCKPKYPSRRDMSVEQWIRQRDERLDKLWKKNTKTAETAWKNKFSEREQIIRKHIKRLKEKLEPEQLQKTLQSKLDLVDRQFEGRERRAWWRKQILVHRAKQEALLRREELQAILQARRKALCKRMADQTQAMIQTLEAELQQRAKQAERAKRARIATESPSKQVVPEPNVKAESAPVEANETPRNEDLKRVRAPTPSSPASRRTSQRRKEKEQHEQEQLAFKRAAKAIDEQNNATSLQESSEEESYEYHSQDEIDTTIRCFDSKGDVTAAADRPSVDMPSAPLAPICLEADYKKNLMCKYMSSGNLTKFVAVFPHTASKHAVQEDIRRMCRRKDWISNAKSPRRASSRRKRKDTKPPRKRKRSVRLYQALSLRGRLTLTRSDSGNNSPGVPLPSEPRRKDAKWPRVEDVTDYQWVKQQPSGTSFVYEEGDPVTVVSSISDFSIDGHIQTINSQEVLVRLDKGMGGSLMTIKLDDVRVCRYMLMKTR